MFLERYESLWLLDISPHHHCCMITLCNLLATKYWSFNIAALRDIHLRAWKPNTACIQF